MDNLSGNERRLARRVMIATMVTLVVSTALFVNRPYLIAAGAALATTAADATGAAGPRFSPHTAPLAAAAPRQAAQPGDARPHNLARDHDQPLKDSMAPGSMAPGSTRQRLIGATGPVPADDAIIDLPAPDAALFALAARSPRMVGPADFGLLYRLPPERRYLLPQRSLALSERLPLIWAKSSAVPEPDSWTMLIVGLLLTGALLRRPPADRTPADWRPSRRPQPGTQV